MPYPAATPRHFPRRLNRAPMLSRCSLAPECILRPAIAVGHARCAGASPTPAAAGPLARRFLGRLLTAFLCLAVIACARPKPTPAVPTIPATWSLYRSPGGFSLHHPPSWERQEETSRHTLFRLPDGAAFGIGVFDARCDFSQGCDAFLSCATPLITEGLDPGREHKVISSGGWGDDGCCGCVLDSTTTGGEREPTYFVQVFVPLAGGRMAVATYYRHGATAVSQAERDLVTDIVRTFQVTPAGRTAWRCMDGLECT